jgi:hypothetical protein
MNFYYVFLRNEELDYEYVTHSGLTESQALKIINDDIERLANLFNCTPKEAEKYSKLYINMYI